MEKVRQRQLHAGGARIGMARDGRVEIDPPADAIALAGLDVHQGDLRTVDLPARQFSAIVIRHVFEHVSEPAATLRRSLSLL